MLHLKQVLVLLLNYLLLIKAQNGDLERTTGITSDNQIDPLDYVNPDDLASPPNIAETLDNNFVEPQETFNEGVETVPKDFVLSWQARRSVRQILAQMPCGWPEYNISALSPYVNEDFSFQIQNQFVKSKTNFEPILIDGLNHMKINRLTISDVLKSINFDFNFPRINFTGNFNTSNVIDWEELLGVRLTAKGIGKLDVSLENLRISGSLKYTNPFLFGTTKIYKLHTQVFLGNVRSLLNGSINGNQIAGKLNNLIETNILKYFNEFDYIWNGLIDRYLVSTINNQLNGKTLWKILSWSLSRNANSCTPGTLLNMEMEELHQLLLKGKQNSPQQLDAH